MTNEGANLTPEQALDQLEALYDRSVNALREAIGVYIEKGELPDVEAREKGLFVYPQLSVSWNGSASKPSKTRAYARFTHAGRYSTTITRPSLFRAYLIEQLTLLCQDYGAQIEVGLSAHEIPYPYVIDGSELTLDRSMSAGLTRFFPTTELAQIGDETADGLFHPTELYPLSHFDARRVDFPLARLRHYTGTQVEHFQPFVLFTNYTRYVDEFVRWGCSQILDPDSPYIALSCAGGHWITADTEAPEQAISDLAWKKHQMPAWHLVTADGQGITLINIGVGPSNAKTICDHLAVLRPDVWLMIGHCGGLRESQQIGDETADGLFHADAKSPLSHFDALRTDFSLARLRHYTGTSVEHFQPFVLFTNYTRYVDEFVRWAIEQVRDPSTPYDSLACAGDVVLTADTADSESMLSDLAWKKHQMPAWHLTSPNRRGITLINIGVGPSNAKTICDHLAVMRPHAWLMIGHCGGLRESQRIGDYVLAHAYLRDDHVLDSVLPPDIPVPSIAEVQRALYDATKSVSGMPGEEVKQRLRTGTVVTTDDRNWELRYSASALRFNLSRAVAVDMESATIAAQGYRFRVPYGTLLCVSDKPLHGEIKLPGQANRFYEGAISEHLQIGIHAVELLRAEGDKLHSRKLRTFNEPPFR